MGNYVTKVERPEGSATRVEANVHGINVAFIKGKDGRPREVSRNRGAMVYDQESLYIRSSDYSGVIRQVSAILNGKPTKKPRQLGFNFNEEV